MHDSTFGRLAGVLLEPRATFASIAARPTWVAPLLVLIVSSLALGAVLVPRMDLESAIRAQLAESGRATAEQIDQQIGVAVQVTTVITWASFIVGPPVVLLLVALVFWGGSRVMGGELGFRHSLSVTAHGWMPHVLAALIAIPVVMAKGSIDLEAVQSGSFLASSLGFFVDAAEHPVLGALASSVDVFSLWAIALLVIGYRVVAKLSANAALAVVGVPWLVVVLGKVGWIAVTTMMKG